MKLYSVKLTYQTGIAAHFDCLRTLEAAKRLVARLKNDLCYQHYLTVEIEVRKVGLLEWLGFLS